jgi:addiction module RelB/DinJ family antitoxin
VVLNSIQVEDSFFEKADEVFKSANLTINEAINLFLEKVSTEKRIPFEIEESRVFHELQEKSLSEVWDNREDEAWNEC